MKDDFMSLKEGDTVLFKDKENGFYLPYTIDMVGRDLFLITINKIPVKISRKTGVEYREGVRELHTFGYYQKTGYSLGVSVVVEMVGGEFKDQSKEEAEYRELRSKKREEISEITDLIEDMSRFDTSELHKLELNQIESIRLRTFELKTAMYEMTK